MIKNITLKNTLKYIIVGILGYVLIACLFYRFHNPTQTETQLFLHFGKALTFKW